MKIISVVGARPIPRQARDRILLAKPSRWEKVAPIDKAIKQLEIINDKLKIEHLICHTGQSNYWF